MTDQALALRRLRQSRFRVHLRGFWRAWLTFAKDKVAVGALVFLLLVAIVSILAPLVSPHDPAEMVANINAPPGSEGLLLGADVDGRDILSRLIWGGRIALLVGIAPTAAATIISLLLGLMAGYLGGWVDQVVMRAMDILFTFPLVLLAIVIAGVLQPGVPT
ncbi:MAG: ABC transporter permease, partial [Nevskiales bacterium]